MQSILYLNNRRHHLSADISSTKGSSSSNIAAGDRKQLQQNDASPPQHPLGPHHQNDGVGNEEDFDSQSESATNDDNENNVEDNGDGDDAGVSPEISLKLEWMVNDWSRCSQTCGPDGKQVGVNRSLNQLSFTVCGKPHSLTHHQIICPL